MKWSTLELKRIIAYGLGAAINLDRCIQARKDRYVLSYHRVLAARQAESDGIHHALWITPEGLAAQIRWMKSVGEIVDFRRIIDPTFPHDRPLFALTFDDGWKDNYEHALPILKKYNVPALIFLATEAIDTDELFWPQDIATKTQRLLLKGQTGQVITALIDVWPHAEASNCIRQSNVLEVVESWIEVLKLISEHEREELIADYFHRLHVSKAPLKGYILNWDEAREMLAHGISFGSHTHRHTIVEGLSPELIESELRRSKALIADKLQIEVDSFCYPNGRYSGHEGAILNRCGYRYGFRLDNLPLRHFTDNFYIPRFLASERKIATEAYLKLCLLESPMYRFKPHKTAWGSTRHE